VSSVLEIGECDRRIERRCRPHLLVGPLGLVPFDHFQGVLVAEDVTREGGIGLECGWLAFRVPTRCSAGQCRQLHLRFAVAHVFEPFARLWW